MSNLKVGDIVRVDRISRDRRRGVITKVETRGYARDRTVRTYAVVFWFGSRVSRAVNADYLIKVEDRGV